VKRILIVKVTSLGDVVQTLPVVADLHRAFPGVAVDWAVDESCAEVVRWHPGVSNVLCAPLRRFKKLRNGGDFKAISASIGALRASLRCGHRSARRLQERDHLGAGARGAPRRLPDPGSRRDGRPLRVLASLRPAAGLRRGTGCA
jgi:hypothetical protein